MRTTLFQLPSFGSGVHSYFMAEILHDIADQAFGSGIRPEPRDALARTATATAKLAIPLRLGRRTQVARVV